MAHAKLIGEVVAVEQFDCARKRLTVRVKRADGFERDHVNLMPKDWRCSPPEVSVGDICALVGAPYTYTRQDGTQSTGLRDVVLVPVN